VGSKKYTREQVEEKVVRVVREQLSLGRLMEIKMVSRLDEDLGGDELDMVELAMVLEGEFGVSIDEEDQDGWEVVADVVATVRKELGMK